MKAVISHARLISVSTVNFTSKETGEVRVYQKALFVQDGCEPLLITIDDALLPDCVPLAIYDVELDISSFNRRFVVKVVGLSMVDD